MRHTRAFTIDRDIDDVKKQVQRELDTIRDLMDTTGYRSSPQDWNQPYHLHRLRRALRIHYLALKIRDSAPVVPSTRELSWELEATQDLM